MKRNSVILLLGILLISLVAAATITTTLISPEDNSYVLENPATFNCSISSDGIAKNVSLYSNSTGIWHLNETKNLTSISTDAHGYGFTTASATAWWGMKFKANEGRESLVFTKSTSATPTNAKLYWENGTEIETIAFIGNNATFTSNLVSGEEYRIEASIDGASSYTLAYNDSGAYPKNQDGINWTGSSIGGIDAVGNPTRYANFISLTSAGVSTQSSNSETFEVNLTSTTEWNCLGCDIDGTCEFAGDNSTVMFSETLFTYNESTYETASETFSIDFSDISPYSVYLNYNGTEYSATNTGSGIWNRTIDILTGNTTRNFFWRYIIGGNSYYSNNKTQIVGNISFTFCNATYSDDFLNISFKDEADLSYINATIPLSSFVYYLGSGTVNKTYSYTNNTNNYNYSFCATPTDRVIKVLPYIQYKQGTTYPQRIWDASVTNYISTVTNKILYLLGSDDGIYVTFQVINSADQVISGVSASATRSISGSDVIVATGTTGDSGSVTFWLNPDYEHTFEFTKTGLTDYTTTFAPTQSSYTITMGAGTTTQNSTIRGIDYSILPTETFLLNDSIYTFAFNLTSSYWEIGEYGFNLRLANGTEIDGGSTTNEDDQIELNYNITNQTIIYIDYYWLIEGNYTNATRYWVVQNTDYTGWSIKTFFTDLGTYLDSGLFGLDNFGRYLIAFLVIFISVGIMQYKYGVTSQLGITSLIFGIIFFFDVITGILPSIRGIPNLPTFLAGLILIISIFKEVQR